jgi:hypothetical protein
MTDLPGDPGGSFAPPVTPGGLAPPSPANGAPNGAREPVRSRLIVDVERLAELDLAGLQVFSDGILSREEIVEWLRRVIRLFEGDADAEILDEERDGR